MPPATRTTGAAVHRLEFDVEFPPGHVAAYLVPGDEPVLVDAGTPGSTGTDELAAGLAAVGYEPADVDHVLLTHLHVDHVGQVAHLREVADATIHAPTPLRDRLARSVETIERTSRDTLLAAGVEETLIDRMLSEIIESEALMRDLLAVEDVGQWLEPGDPATVGDLAIDTIHTPGHHVTHACYATEVADEAVLFSGDMLIEPFRAMTINAGFDEGVDDGIDDYLTALDRLASRTVDRVFPGHGPVHTDAAGAHERSVAGLERRLDACEDALRPGGSTALHVAGNLSAADREAGRLLPEIIAALVTLERQGRATVRREGDVRYFEPV